MAITLDANLGTLNQDGTSTTIVLTTAAAVAAGGFIVLGVTANDTTNIVSSVSGGGLTWSVDKQGNGAGAAANLGVAICSAQAPAGLAASTAITVTLTGNIGARTIGGNSFLGVATSSPVDGTPTGPTSALDTAAWATASYSIAAGSMIYAVCWMDEQPLGSTTTSPSLEAWEQLNGANNYGTVAGYRIEASAASYTVAGTWGGATDWNNVAVAYLASTDAPQTLRPDADIVTTGWATAPLWSKIEESSADGTVITATAA